MALFLGLMSGTSLDGVDAVLAEIDDGQAPRAVAHRHEPFDPTLRDELLALNTPGPDELHRAALAANAVARAYGGVVHRLLEGHGIAPAAVRAIGAHGQTVRHRPQAVDGTGYTLQLLNGALLAELAGIDVVCDLRSRDIAAGGQGAPLVPAFHAACFRRPGASTDLAVLNLGGIANLTLLPARGPVRGFDCGPANVLLDGWCRRHRHQPYDADGRWAASGSVQPRLLGELLAEPYLRQPPPKSTGRELFDMPWLDVRLGALAAAIEAVDVMATLAEFTARAAVDALRREQPATSELLVCGGGAFNGHLMSRLAALLPGVAVHGTAARGVAPDQVEALAFAWLAAAHVERRCGTLPEVTGARGPRVLGALYPA